LSEAEPIQLSPRGGAGLHSNIAFAHTTFPSTVFFTRKEFTAILDRLWPSIAPAALVADLLSSPSRLARAADGVLTPDEQAAILRSGTTSGRRRTIPWTEADTALVDEAHERIGGRARAYGHVVVDEAQDLSPMQLRMLARRSLSGSMTVVGDIAQATGQWSPSSWDDVLAHLPTRRGTHVVELTVNYRTPSEIMEVAARVLAAAAPHLKPPTSVRSGGERPGVVTVGGLSELAA